MKKHGETYEIQLLPQFTEMDRQMSFHCFSKIVFICLVKFIINFTKNSYFIKFSSDFTLNDLQYKFN